MNCTNKTMAGRADEVVLETWGGRKTFGYSGSVKQGTRINYGEKGYSSVVSAGSNWERGRMADG